MDDHALIAVADDGAPFMLPAVPTRAQIDRLEREMVLLGGRNDYNVQHYFAEGLYGRVLTVDAGHSIVGKVHKSENLFAMIQGEMTIWTEQGMRCVAAGFVTVTKPGTKRVGWAHTEVVCMTVHANPTNERDLAKLEAMYIEAPALAAPEEVECLG